ncbi:hypothetical protein TNCV_775481 [Trichonephila clavipes]|uniref:CCHC-type domain-containing protein n=1 Tax=Trichonephila clavipes TaxID=2585209 RepID=A0A8X6SLT6_TRICX|nr:hypothetical protein TNCV_775481 [Trichonephila clavipes]
MYATIRPLLTQTAPEKFNLIELIPKYDGSESLGIRRFLGKISDVAHLVPFHQWAAKRYSQICFGTRPQNNLEESINAALIEEQNVKLNQIANDERTGLSPLHTETSVISALTNKLDEINLRVERLQEASSVTARKTGGGLFRRRETVFKCFYCGLEGHRQTECRRKRAEERQSNSQPPGEMPRANFLFFATQTLILSTNDASISTTRLFATITQPPGILRPFHKELPVAEEMQLVSDVIREMII